MRINSRTILWIALTTVLATSACSPELPAPTSTPVPASATPQLALTATAQRMTAVAAFSPTVTETPTITKTPYPTITPIPSSTRVLSATPAPVITSVDGTDVTATPGLTPTTDYACRVKAKSPTDWQIMKTGDPFDASWTLQNTGARLWKFGKVVVTWLAGNKFQKDKSKLTYNLPSDVISGDAKAVVLDMIAPSKPNLYSADWGLMVASTKTVFCKFSVRISVTLTGK